MKTLSDVQYECKIKFSGAIRFKIWLLNKLYNISIFNPFCQKL